MNEDEGAIWFDLNIQAVEAKPVRLKTITAELGK